ncbi:MAG: translation initiation factor IF-2 [Faecalibacterium sp. CAG:74_58_120]|nr:MAG: translation initiation factor IF-2 [Faecalibacterium sp. CAG:74_58_120]
MTKVKLKDAIKDLTTDAAKVRDDASRVRQSADGLAKSLRALENGFIKSLNAKAEQEKRAEEEKRLSDHSKAYVMLDVDEQAAVNAARQEAEKAERAEKQEAKSAPKQEAKTEAPKGEQKPAPKAEAKPEVKAEAPKSEQKPAPKAETKPEVKAEAPKSEQKPTPKAEAKPEAKAEAPKSEKKPAPKAEPKPEVKADAPQAEQKPAPKVETKPEAPKKPAIGQIISRPGQALPPKPVGLAPNVIRPPRPQQPRPQGQQGVQGNRPQQGQPRPGGNGAFIARPQQGQPRPGGNGAFIARPQQGQNRPGNGSFQPRPGGNGAFVARPQGARPQGGAGFQARPQGGTGRPAGVGMNRPKPAVPDMAPAMGKERVSNYDPNKKNYVRQHDPEHVARNRKQLSRDAGYSGYDDDVVRGGKRSRMKKPSAQQMMAPIKIEHAYMSGDTIVVRDLCEKIGKTSAEIIKKLFLLGNMATINSEIDFDTASLVCADFDITLEKKPEVTAEDQLTAENFDDSEENLQPRPPVVTIMGHVDHGKTSLLDYIRNSRVTAGEAGGITQHIGAYTVKMNGRDITFLDTPGHEAFTAMRARGAQATDIAILVVAADDSVMPQTIEAINHAKAANVPIIVAINKMDKPEADPERVKTDLTKYGIVCEDWGGDTIMCPVSAKTGEGVDELLEMILLQADTMELRANPNRLGRGVIIEAKLDKARGPLATVLMQNGTLHVGDNIIAGLASGRVRALINDRGEKVKEAGPSTPVEIMGFDEVPSAGDEMQAVGDDRLSRQVAEERKAKVKASREATMAKVSLENMFSNMESGKQTTLNLIIKADVQGSVEAVKQAMEKLSSDEVKVHVLHSAAGAITKDDVNLASAFNAIIIGFNIRPDASAREAAEREKVDVRLYTVIYKAIEDMELAMKGLLAPEYREVLLGHAEVRNVFKITGAGVIAGCYVTDGKVQRNAQVRLLRDNVVVFEGKLSSLKHYKEDVKEMAAGFECGMSLEGHNDIKEGDVVECFIMEEIPR